MNNSKQGATSISVFLGLLIASLFIQGCTKSKPVQKKEVLIYCGITMIRPMTEIARIIEEEQNCKIIITKGGSGNLLKALKTNQVGDLYFPGSDSYIKTCIEEDLVTDSVFVGYNKAAIMVPKGNPKHITSDLDNLKCKDYYVVIGNPSSGSIGRETRKILEAKGIFEEVQENAREMTADSKMLFTVIKDKKADIVINWYATSTWDNNAESVDVLSIDEQYAKKKKLVIGLLKTSSHPDIAKRFMEYAASDKGQALFQKYGLYEVK